MSDRRVLSTPQANTEEAALRLLPSWKKQFDTADVRQVNGQWAVTAAKAAKRESR